MSVIAPRALLPRRLAAHHDRRLGLELIDPERHETDHVLVDAHVALHLVHRLDRGVDVEEDVMGLAVLLDPIGQVAQAPVLGLRHLTAAFLDDVGEALGQGRDLLGGDVLARQEHALVERHGLGLLLAVHAPGAHRLSGELPRPSRLGRQGVAGAALYIKRRGGQGRLTPAPGAVFLGPALPPLPPPSDSSPRTPQRARFER